MSVVGSWLSVVGCQLSIDQASFSTRSPGGACSLGISRKWAPQKFQDFAYGLDTVAGNTSGCRHQAERVEGFASTQASAPHWQQTTVRISAPSGAPTASPTPACVFMERTFMCCTFMCLRRARRRDGESHTNRADAAKHRQNAGLNSLVPAGHKPLLRANKSSRNFLNSALLG